MPDQKFHKELHAAVCPHAAHTTIPPLHCPQAFHCSSCGHCLPFGWARTFKHVSVVCVEKAKRGDQDFVNTWLRANARANLDGIAPDKGDVCSVVLAAVGLWFCTVCLGFVTFMLGCGSVVC